MWAARASRLLKHIVVDSESAAPRKNPGWDAKESCAQAVEIHQLTLWPRKDTMPGPHWDLFEKMLPSSSPTRAVFEHARPGDGETLTPAAVPEYEPPKYDSDSDGSDAEMHRLVQSLKLSKKNWCLLV